MHDAGLYHIQLASPRGPLSNGMLGISIALEMQKLKKREKLKNRDLIKFPYII